jgi:Flp pilus assembly protein TadD
VRPASRDIGQKLGSNKFALVLGAVVGLVAIMLHSIVDFNMHIPANALIAIALMALVSGYARFWSDRFWVRTKFGSRIGCTVIGVAIVGLLITNGARTYQEQRLLAKARRAPLFSQEQVSFLGRAFTVEPKNPETALQIAEAARRRAQEGGSRYDEPGATDYKAYTTNSLTWFRTAAQLDPYNSDAWLGEGWCLDWLGNRAESRLAFSKAEEMDPNGSFTVFRIGLHQIDQAQFALARPWFERSLRLEGGERRTAAPYLQVANMRLLEAATNDLAAELLRAESGAKQAIINR